MLEDLEVMLHVCMVNLLQRFSTAMLFVTDIFY